MQQLLTRYPSGRVALGGVNLSVSQGEFLFLIGESGAGKSTLLAMLYGALAPASGSLQVFGIDMNAAPARKISALRRRCGIIFQDHRLLFRRTVFENIALPLRVQGYPEDRMVARVGKVLEFVGLEDAIWSYPDTLSGGEQQRVAIARAMAPQPQLILADEPTGNLDRETADQVLHYLIQLQQHGSTVIIATHDLQLLEQYPARVVELHAGVVVNDSADEASHGH
ncbi:MAG: ATP-binding cassette domain-containing protein [Mariprofundales bacterium]|nr:ATP-binding cassette domain-containing protein [Mariprofundales bacterium]